MTNENAEPDLTIGDLVARGDRLGLYCDACSRFRYMRTENLPGSLNIKGMADQLSCIKCWSPDGRDAASAAGRTNRILAGGERLKTMGRRRY
jgi:hypothetical protein